jgi:predicted ATPase
MQIESIEIKNYRLFRDTKLQNIPRLCVLVGANGTGKSTLFDVFSFLKDALAMNVGKAVSKRGGYKELASRGFADQPIELTLQFRLEITGYERLVTYILRIEPDATGRAVVAREVLRYKRGANGKPFHFLDFANGAATRSPTKRTSQRSTRPCCAKSRNWTRPTSWPSRASASSSDSRRPVRSA